MDLFSDRQFFCLQRSKTDHEGRGRGVSLYPVAGSLVCPVLCLRQFLDYHGRVPRVDRPLLAHADGSFFSRFQFVSVFRMGIRALGLVESDYSGHSFRIGASTETAQLGLGEEAIQRIGRWESHHFKSYVRLNRL